MNEEIPKTTSAPAANEPKRRRTGRAFSKRWLLVGMTVAGLVSLLVTTSLVLTREKFSTAVSPSQRQGLGDALPRPDSPPSPNKMSIPEQVNQHQQTGFFASGESYESNDISPPETSISGTYEAASAFADADATSPEEQEGETVGGAGAQVPAIHRGADDSLTPDVFEDTAVAARHVHGSSNGATSRDQPPEITCADEPAPVTGRARPSRMIGSSTVTERPTEHETRTLTPVLEDENTAGGHIHLDEGRVTSRAEPTAESLDYEIRPHPGLEEGPSQSSALENQQDARKNDALRKYEEPEGQHGSPDGHRDAQESDALREDGDSEGYYEVPPDEETSVARLEQAVLADDPEYLYLALRDVVRCEDYAVPPLRDLFASTEDFETKMAVAVALAKIGTSSAVQGLTESIASERDLDERRLLAATLRSVREARALPDLLENVSWAGDEDPVGYESAQAIGTMLTAELLPVLAQRLESEAQVDNKEAVALLGDILATIDEPALTESLFSVWAALDVPSATPFVAQGLARIGTAESVDALVSIAAAADGSVQDGIARALTQVHTDDGFSALQSAVLDYPDNTIGKSAAVALATNYETRGIEYLATIHNDLADTTVEEVVAELLLATSEERDGRP